MHERSTVRLAPTSVQNARLARAIGKASLFIAATWGAGVVGYHWFAGLGWVDSILNASMILGGMGPVNELSTSGAKLFASAYALFSGLVFVVAMGFVLAPILHRGLHKLHLDDLDLEAKASAVEDVSTSDS